MKASAEAYLKNPKVKADLEKAKQRDPEFSLDLTDESIFAVCCGEKSARCKQVMFVLASDGEEAKARALAEGFNHGGGVLLAKKLA